MLLLHELWAGNIAPGERQYRKPVEYEKIRRKMEQYQHAVKQELSEKTVAVFDELLELYATVEDMSMCDSFISGFRTGALTMIDVLCPGVEKSTESL